LAAGAQAFDNKIGGRRSRLLASQPLWKNKHQRTNPHHLFAPKCDKAHRRARARAVSRQGKASKQLIIEQIMAPQDNCRRFTELYRTGILCGRGGGARRRLACAASELAARRALAWLRRRRRARRRRQRQQEDEQGEPAPTTAPSPLPHLLPRTPLPASPDRPAPSPSEAVAAATATPPLPLPDPLRPPHDARATALVASVAALAAVATTTSGLSDRAASSAAWREVAAELARRAANAPPLPPPPPSKRERPPPPQQPLPKRMRRGQPADDAAGGLRRSKRRPPVEVVVIDDSSDEDEKKEKEEQPQPGASSVGAGSLSSPLISARDLTTLKPRNWLNDECINAYFALIQRRQQQQRQRAANGGSPSAAASSSSVSSPPLLVICFSSFFFTLVTSSRGLDGRYDYDAVRRWTMKACFGDGDGGDAAASSPAPLIARCHLILAPVHLSGAHWALAAVWPSLGRVEVFDTLAGPSLSAAPAAVARVFARWLEDEARDKGVRLPVPRLRARACPAPLQRDSNSCGVLVCAMAERLAAGLPARALEAALGGNGGGGIGGPAAAGLRLGLARELVKGRLGGQEE
jgi:hypothetical protein